MITMRSTIPKITKSKHVFEENKKRKEHKVNKGKYTELLKGEKIKTKGLTIDQGGRQFIITPVSRKLQKVIIIPSTTPSLPSCANYKCNNPSFKMENKIVCNMQTDNTRQNYRLGHLHRFKRQCMSLKSFLELQTMYSSH